jgi:hypothetical protein
MEMYKNSGERSHAEEWLGNRGELLCEDVCVGGPGISEYKKHEVGQVPCDVWLSQGNHHGMD